MSSHAPAPARQAFTALGVPAIDRQHRVIAERWQLLARAGATGDAARVRTNLWFLRAYFAEHFATEEALMAEAGYPGLPRHARLHAELLVRLAGLQAAQAAGTDPWGRGEFACLLDWVRTHIDDQDAVMGRFLQARQRIAAVRGAAGGA
jgi:hemerythrin-like metal-binding protein